MMHLGIDHRENVRSSIWTLVPVTACRFSIGKISYTYDFVPLSLPILFIDALEQLREENVSNGNCCLFLSIIIFVFITLILLYFSNRSLSSATHTRVHNVWEDIDCIRCNICHQTAEVRTNGSSMQWIDFLSKENRIFDFILYRCSLINQDSSTKQVRSCSDLLSEWRCPLGDSHRWRIQFRKKKKEVVCLYDIDI